MAWLGVDRCDLDHSHRRQSTDLFRGGAEVLVRFAGSSRTPVYLASDSPDRRIAASSNDEPGASRRPEFVDRTSEDS